MSFKIRKLAEDLGDVLNRDELLELPDAKEFDDRAVQSFKDQCDINKMLKKAQTAGSLSHLMKYPEATYGEFDGEFDLLTAKARIQRANDIFADLPSEMRAEFNNDALSFVRFAGDPANNDRLRELFPAIAAPGSYFPNPVKRGGTGAGAATPEVIPAGAVPPEGGADNGGDSSAPPGGTEVSVPQS